MVHNLSFVPAGGLTPAPAPLTGPLALATTTAPISAEVPLKLIYVTQVPIVGNVAVTVAENQTLDEVKRGSPRPWWRIAGCTSARLGSALSAQGDPAQHANLGSDAGLRCAQVFLARMVGVVPSPPRRGARDWWSYPSQGPSPGLD